MFDMSLLLGLRTEIGSEGNRYVVTRFECKLNQAGWEGGEG